jgi:hypothetical protein
MIVWTTAMGYVSMTAKELAKGKRAARRDRARRRLARVPRRGCAGRGLGIYGDFLFGEANRSGAGTAGTLLGPAIGEVAQVNDIFKRALRGEASAAEGLREALRVASGVHPTAAFVVNGYPRIALDYLILYRIQEELSPGYLRRMEQRMRKENAQELPSRRRSTPSDDFSLDRPPPGRE